LSDLLTFETVFEFISTYIYTVNCADFLLAFAQNEHTSVDRNGFCIRRTAVVHHPAIKNWKLQYWKHGKHWELWRNRSDLSSFQWIVALDVRS